MRILFIFSKNKTRSLLQKVLEQHAFTVDVERDFQKGLRNACANSYHAGIVEHALPHLNAESFVREVRDRGHSLPLLVIIPERDDLLGTICLDHGADDFMKVPVSISELVARVRSLLRRPAKIEADDIRIGPLLINRLKQTVKKSGREVRLTAKQYAVLEILAAQEGAIVSKGEIIEHVWGESDGIHFERALETHIYHLRRKLDRGGKGLISTEFGRGYRLN